MSGRSDVAGTNGGASAYGCDFGQHLTLEATSHIEAGFRLGHPHFSKAIREHFEPAFGGFLRELRNHGALAPIQGAEGHKIRFIDAWNAFAAGPESPEDDRHALNMLAHYLGHRIVFKALFRRGKDDVPMPAEEARAAIVARANPGNFSWLDHIEEQTDLVTGERYYVDIRGWRASVGSAGDDGELVPIAPIETPLVRHLEFDVRGTELLAADWFRIEEFTKAVDDELVQRYSLNCEEGSFRVTEEYVKKGVISVLVGNSCPNVFVGDDAIMIGNLVEEDADEEEQAVVSPISLGYICTDLWRASFIEYDRLVEIVSKRAGDRAKDVVDAYLEEHQGNFLRVPIEPGHYHLYFGTDLDAFPERFKSPELDFPGIAPLMVISKNELRPEEKPAPAKGLRP
jgi:hypothetical protein